MLRIAAGMLLLPLLFTSCKKYEEGPALSFRSKMARLEGSWQLRKWTINGTEQDLSQTTWRLNIHRSGNYDKFITYNIPPLPTTIDSEQGSWEFDKKKEHVEFLDNSQPTALSHEILKLYHRELWLRFDDGTDVQEFQYALIE